MMKPVDMRILKWLQNLSRGGGPQLQGEAKKSVFSGESQGYKEIRGFYKWIYGFNLGSGETKEILMAKERGGTLKV